MQFDTNAATVRPERLNFNKIVANNLADRRFYAAYAKRVLDIILVIVAAPIALLIVVLACPFIMRDGGSPFFAQERVGRDGRIFRMWKLRSMVCDAENRLEAYLDACPERRREWEARQKLRHDTRVTPIGRFIRKSSIDELPQLWNVFLGEMSLVGPRPMLPSQRELYPGTAYYAMRPGITGSWQVSVRNDSDFAQRAELDTGYFDELSLRTDLVVMLRTVRAVLCGTGC